MQALSSYNPSSQATILSALRKFHAESKSKGFSASTCFSEHGRFVRFVWPDWPVAVAGELAQQVEKFRLTVPDFKTVPAETREWNGVFHGWSSDPSSAAVIATAFEKHFGPRLTWVESERDRRGSIHANFRIKNIAHVQRFEYAEHLRFLPVPQAEQIEVMWMDLTWKESFAPIPETITDSDREALEAGLQEVFAWASSRVRPILDALHEKLESLYGERFRGLYVFGSYARPDAGIELPVDSDLDVALILSNIESRYEELERIGDITYDLSLEHGLSVSVTPVLESDFREGSTTFTRVISSYAIPVG